MTLSNDATVGRKSSEPPTEELALNEFAAPTLAGDWARLYLENPPLRPSDLTCLLELAQVLGDAPGAPIIDEVSRLRERCSAGSWELADFSDLMRSGLLPLVEGIAETSPTELHRIVPWIIRHTPHERFITGAEIYCPAQFFDFVVSFARALNPECQGRILLKLGTFLDDSRRQNTPYAEQMLLNVMLPAIQLLGDTLTEEDFDSLCDLAHTYARQPDGNLRFAIAELPREWGIQGISALLNFDVWEGFTARDIAKLAAKTGGFHNLDWVPELITRLRQRIIDTFPDYEFANCSLPNINLLCELAQRGEAELSPEAMQQLSDALYGSALRIACALRAHTRRLLLRFHETYHATERSLSQKEALAPLFYSVQLENVLRLFYQAAQSNQAFTLEDVANFGDEIEKCLVNYHPDNADFDSASQDLTSAHSGWINPAVAVFGFRGPVLLNMAVENGSGPTDLSRLTEHERYEYLGAQVELSADKTKHLKSVLNQGGSHVYNSGYTRGLILNMVKPRLLGREPEGTQSLLNRYQSADLTPVLRLPPQGFTFSIPAQDTVEVSFKPRKRPDPGLLNKIRGFCAKSINPTTGPLRTVTSKYGIKSIEDITLFDIFDERNTSPSMAIERFNDLFPLLPQRLRINIFPAPNDDASPSELRSFYQTFLDLVLEPLCNESLPPGIRYPYFHSSTDAAKLNSPIILLDLISKVQCELKKFSVKASYRGTRQVAMAISKGPLDAFYGELGDCCANTHYRCELERSDFQPMRLFDPNTLEQLGETYTFTRTVDDHPALIVAGILPKRHFAQSVSQELLVAGIIQGLKVIALENGLVDSNGVPAVYTNCGGPNWGQADGRIAQLYELHKIIRRLTRSEHQTRAIQLDPSQAIAFPSIRKDDPIQWIARFA